jgi:putative ABC transport system permease protein
MSLWHIAWRYLWDKKLTTALTILSVALAVGLISTVLTLRDETKKRFEEEQLVYDAVVGPSGSPLQLVLNAVYYLDQPTGIIPYSIYEEIKAHENVTYAFPIALGDNYKEFRIVGTEPELFDFPWENPSTGELRYPFKLAEGRMFTPGTLEAVLGYLPGRQTGLEVGDTFVGTHGDTLPGVEDPHAATPYTVVGKLQASGTSNDRAIFVPLDAVWAIHEDHEENEDGETAEHEDEKEVSAILVDLYAPLQRWSFQREMMDRFGVSAAAPVDQVLYLYRQILEPAVALLKGIGYIVVVISALSILIGLYLSIIQRKRDLAVMRALGASAPEIFGAVLIEAFLVSVIGIACGWVFGKTASFALAQYISREYGFTISGLSTSFEELQFFAAVAVVGLIAGILPAWQAYRVDIAQDLAAN